MIVIHIDSQQDTAFLKECYKGVNNLILLYNPTKAEVDTALTENPTEDVMMLGHGSSAGLFSASWGGYVIDYTNAHLLKGRNCIGIWCWAKNFAKTHGLKGYFTSMFISNAGEAKSFNYNATEEEVFEEVKFFAKAINTLIVEGYSYDMWVGKLQSIADMSKAFVKYNYSNMEYFDGTQKVEKSVEDYPSLWGGTYPADAEIDLEQTADSEVDMWFDDYCIEHNIEGDWAREIAYPIFVAGWNSHKYSADM